MACHWFWCVFWCLFWQWPLPETWRLTWCAICSDAYPDMCCDVWFGKFHATYICAFRGVYSDMRPNIWFGRLANFHLICWDLKAQFHVAHVLVCELALRFCKTCAKPQQTGLRFCYERSATTTFLPTFGKKLHFESSPSWHTMLTFYLASILTFFDSTWHVFLFPIWHSIGPLFSHSICNSIWPSIWHSFWHLF